MIHVIHWQQGNTEGAIEQDGCTTIKAAKASARKILAEGYGLTKAKITEVEVYGGHRHNKNGQQTA